MPGFSRRRLGSPPPCVAAFIGLGGNLEAEMEAGEVFGRIVLVRVMKVGLGIYNATKPQANGYGRAEMSI